MKVMVDATLCQGHGLCYMSAPTLFEPDDEGNAVATAAELGVADEALAREASDSCPERAIRVVDRPAGVD